MVQHVEHFSAELQFDGFMDWKVAMDREVPLRGTESPEEISRYISLPERVSRVGVSRRVLECVYIKRLSARILLTAQVKNLSRNYIGTNIGLETAIQLLKVPVRNLNGRSRASLNDVLDGPTTQNRVGKRVALGKRDVVSHSRGKCVTDIKVGRPSVRVCVSS